MDAANQPVEMIATCGPDGSLLPARFRVEGEAGERVTVRIRKIKDSEEISYRGIEAFRFVCLALIGGRLRLFELRYTVRSHRWVFWRFLDGEG